MTLVAENLETENSLASARSVLSSKQKIFGASDEVNIRRQNETREREEFVLWLGLFYLVNQVIIKFSLRVPYIQEVAQDLNTFLSLFTAICSVVLLIAYFPIAFSQSYSELAAKKLGVATLRFLALATMAVNFAIQFFTNFSGFALEELSCSITALIVALCLTNVLERMVRQRLRMAQGFDLVRFAPRCRIMRGENETSTAQSSSRFEVDSMLREDLIPTAKLKVGDLLRVFDEEFIVADGVVVEGLAEIEERRISGLTKTRVKQQGDPVFAGSKVIKGDIKVRVNACYYDSFISTFAKRLNDNLTYSNQPSLEEWGMRGESLYAALLITLALGAALYWIGTGAPFSVVSIVASSVLLVSLLPQNLDLTQDMLNIFHTSAFFRGIQFERGDFVPAALGVKNLLIDCRGNKLPGEREVVDFQIIDARVDEQMLCNVVTVLLSRANDDFSKACVRHLRPKLRHLALFEVEDCRVYDDQGVCGLVESTEVSIGSEDFMLERGVEMQASDLAQNSEDFVFYYVALDENIVARVKTAQPFTTDGRQVVSHLDALGISCKVLSSESEVPVLHKLANSLGLPLAHILPCADQLQFERILREQEHSAIYLTDSEPSKESRANLLSLSVFDDVLWDTGRSNLLFFSKSLHSIQDLFALLKSFRRTRFLNLFMVSSLSVILLALAVCGLITPVVAAIAVASGTLFIGLNALGLMPEI